jgi:hypothetical protein
MRYILIVKDEATGVLKIAHYNTCQKKSEKKVVKRNLFIK